MKNFETFFIEAKAKSIDKKIETAIKKSGIVYPHHALSFFKAIYAKVDGVTPNSNGVILAESVKDDVKYLIGTQVNRDHLRYGNILGHIIDAYINDNEEIEIIFTFDKDVYSKEHDEALELMAEDKLTVSFELRVDKKNIEIIDGNKKIEKIKFLGVGLLFGIKPAYSNAYVLETAMRVVEEAFNQDDKQLVYAAAQDISKKWTRIGELIEGAIKDKNNMQDKKGGNNMEQKAKDVLLAKFKEEVTLELGKDAVKGWSDEQWEAELVRRADLEQVELKKIEAEKLKSGEEVKAEAKKTVYETDEKVKTKITYDTETNEERVESEVDTVSKTDGEVTFTKKLKSDVTYTYAEMEAVKAEYETKLVAKDEEIKFIKENASKVEKVRAEYGEYVKDYSDVELFDESKMEIAKLKKENAELKADKAVVTASDKSDDKLDEDLAASNADPKLIQVSEKNKTDALTQLLKKRI